MIRIDARAALMVALIIFAVVLPIWIAVKIMGT